MADPITGMITCVINGLTYALDNMGNQFAAPKLKPPTGSSSQTWIYYPDTLQLQATNFPNVNNGWVGLRSDNLQIDNEWLNATMYWTFSSGTLQSGYNNEYLVPTTDHTAVTLNSTASGAVWTLGASYPGSSGYVPSGYTLVWNDEFQGITVSGVSTPQVDTSKWVFRYSYSGGTLDYLSGNDELQRYREGENSQPNHIITAGGTVQLTAYPQQTYSDGTYFSSGMLRSKKYFDVSSLTAGTYFEARIKTCAGIGSWPAFWLSGTANSDGTLSWPPEIDISERSMDDSISPPTINFDSGTQVVHLGPQTNGLDPGPWNNVAAAWATPLPQNSYTWNSPTGELYVGTPFDITAGFHVYGLLITPGASGQYVNSLTNQPTHVVKYYIDGQLCLTHVYDSQFWPDGTSCRGMDILFDLAIGGRMGGTPNFSSAIHEEIDYVRVYTSDGNFHGGTAANLVDYTCPSTGY